MGVTGNEPHFQSRHTRFHFGQLGQTIKARIRPIPQRIGHAPVHARDLPTLQRAISHSEINKNSQRTDRGADSLHRLHSCTAFHTRSISPGTDIFTARARLWGHTCL
ncbi:hypothetical protein ARGLB_054_00850 [Arthrobacter globiformis NBRC 12137]|uniref:Uncharacterized protein n=1 Tax=Arthrobacter globiformis (strain ATCC 8010 / DSM 20124 / JCM 1332 / NBRC 12137 / NCIMB 8907 / NRRL B-2979 / 168) TaxID=1077972 RepID=H0QMN0_ARTG1|nr:hypothetical protein [Arthrobacter globiformis]GAB14081.1 hypothetical protein ARGLB_054_00850 [Arthrobacter globiformis NBRC 12137]